MSNSKRFIAYAVTKYADNDGTERKNYVRCGVAFLNQTTDGKEVINPKFDFFPVGQGVEIVFFEPKPKDDNGDVIE